MHSILIVVIHSNVLHIVTSQSPSCLKKPCLTLNHLASNASLKHHINITLILQAGNHNLDSEVSIMNISELTMLSSFTLHQRVTVTCNCSGMFCLTNIDHVSISGLHFLWCGINRFADVNLSLIHI